MTGTTSMNEVERAVKDNAERVMNHLLFELAYRDGIYDELIKEDELCE